MISFVSVFILFFSLASCQPDYVVDTTTGRLRGFSPFPNVAAWLGIPYAEPPVGNLRFAPPQPLLAPNGSARDCYRNSAGCFQLQFQTAFSDKESGIAESEDMLSINIWKPVGNATSGALPVMILLFPGGFTSGANGLSQYSGQELVAEQQDIIFASINYRVNVFGFPNTPALPTKNPGLLDQRLAVSWLRDNIRAFGGDPARMTLAGHSAGSQSAAYWSYAYEHDPVVGALIEFSGQPGTVPNDDGSSWLQLANATGCASTDPQKELACMRSVPARQLKRALSYNNFPSFTDPFISGGTPAVDNKTVFALSAYPKLGKAGKFARLPLLVSNTLAEADIVLPFTPEGGVNQTLSDLVTLAQFHCPVASTSSIWASHNVTTYRYLMNGSFAAENAYPWVRPYHGSDFALVMGQVGRVQYQDESSAALDAGRYIRNAVAAFVKDPVNGLAQFGWERYDPGASTLMKLFGNETAAVSTIDPQQYDAVCQSL